MNFSDYNFRQWIIRAVAGLVISSMGLCMVVESAFIKHDTTADLNWVLVGTVALIVFNTGLCLLIDSLRFKMKYEEQ